MHHLIGTAGASMRNDDEVGSQRFGVHPGFLRTPRSKLVIRAGTGGKKGTQRGGNIDADSIHIRLTGSVVTLIQAVEAHVASYSMCPYDL